MDGEGVSNMWTWDVVNVGLGQCRSSVEYPIAKKRKCNS